MQTIFSNTLLALCIAATVMAAPQRMTVAGKAEHVLPAAVQAAFKQAYPDAVIKHASRETDHGKTVFEIESVDRGQARDLVYAADGTVLECEETIAVADVPAAVSAALKALYPKASIAKAEKTTRGPALQYDLALKGAPVKEVAFSADGRRIGDEKVK